MTAILWLLAVLGVVGGIIALGRPSVELCGGAILLVCVALIGLTVRNWGRGDG